MLRHKRHKRHKVCSGSASRDDCPLTMLVPAVEMCEESELSELSLGMAIRMDVVRSGCSAKTGEPPAGTTSIGDKRDDMSACAAGIGNCPVCHPASVVPWPRLAWAFQGWDVS
jgi:hypothetical protein